jgi:hypothetical protein
MFTKLAQQPLGKRKKSLPSSDKSAAKVLYLKLNHHLTGSHTARKECPQLQRIERDRGTFQGCPSQKKKKKNCC